MTGRAIVDTGPLVAYLDRAEKHHAWTAARVRELRIPLLVCEPVLTEALFLLSRLPAARNALFALLTNGALRIGFRAGEHVPELRGLMEKYRDRPMSFADACIVRMAELHASHAVFTLDSDFGIYRTRGRGTIRLIAPSKEGT